MRIGDAKTSYIADEMIFDTPVRRAWFAALIVAILVFPLIGNDYTIYLACLVAINVISATGLNILTGFTGQISLGQAAFMGRGEGLRIRTCRGDIGIDRRIVRGRIKIVEAPAGQIADLGAKGLVAVGHGKAAPQGTVSSWWTQYRPAGGADQPERTCATDFNEPSQVNLSHQAIAPLALANLVNGRDTLI